MSAAQVGSEGSLPNVRFFEAGASSRVTYLVFCTTPLRIQLVPAAIPFNEPETTSTRRAEGTGTPQGDDSFVTCHSPVVPPM